VIPSSQPVVVFVAGWLAVTNVVLAVFNMIPAFPMDGGRVLRALLARNRPYATATRLAAGVGKTFAILFGVFGLLGAGGINPMMVLLALFIYGAASGESRTVVLADLLEGLTVNDLVTDGVATIAADATIAEFVTRMFAERRMQFAVVDDGDVVGIITSDDFRAVPPEDRDTTTVAELMASDLLTLAGSTPAFDALVELDQSRSTEAFVATPGGTRVVSRTDFASAMEMRRMLGTGDPF
jgi:CBS domain-containing protein